MNCRLRKSFGGWAAVLGLVTVAGCGPRDPKLQVDEPEKSLGKVDSGSEIPLKFTLKNTGGAPLKILAVTPECGCVQAEHPEAIPPGGSGEISAQFHPQIQWSGPVKTRLKVQTNDKKQPEVMLTVAADVAPLIKMNPPNPVQLQYKPGQTYQKEVQLVPRPGSKITLQAPEVNVPWIQAKLLPPAPGDATRMQRLKLTLGPMKGPNDQTGVLRFKTSDSQLNEVRMSVMALALEGPVVNPSEIRLPMIAPDSAGKELKQLNVLTRTGELQVSGVETGTPQLRAEVKTTSPGHFYLVTVYAGEKLKPGPIKTTLRVKTNNPKFPVVQVPFESIVQ